MQNPEQKKSNPTLYQVKKIKKSIYYISKSIQRGAQNAVLPFLAGAAFGAIGGSALGPIGVGVGAGAGAASLGSAAFVYETSTNAHRLFKDGAKLANSKSLNQYIEKLTQEIQNKNRNEIETDVMKFYTRLHNQKKLLVEKFIRNLSDDNLKMLYAVNRFAERGNRQNLTGITPQDMDTIMNKYLNKYEFPQKLHQEIKYGFSIKIKELLDEIVIIEAFEKNLIKALETGNTESLQSVLQQKPNINMLLENGLRPLHLACQFQNMEISKMLLIHGSDMQLKDAKGKLPGEYAIHHTFIEELNHVLERNQAMEVELNRQVTRWEEIEKFLNYGELLHKTDRWGDGILHKAALDGNVRIIAEAVKKGADINIQNADGMTPLFSAIGDVGGGYQEVVETLLKHGADPNIKANDHYKNNAPLHNASIYMVSKDVFAMLLKSGADPLARNAENKTFLEVAKPEKRRELIQMIIENPDIISKEYREKTVQVIKAMNALSRNHADGNARQRDRGHLR